MATGLAADMPTPFSGAPSPTADSTGAPASVPSAPPSTLPSSVGPSDTRHPRRPESIFNELSAPSLTSLPEETGMHAYGAILTRAPGPPTWQEVPLPVPRHSFTLTARQSSELVPQVAAATASRGAPAAAVSARCLVPPKPPAAREPGSAPQPDSQQASPADGPPALAGAAAPALRSTPPRLGAEVECSVPRMQDVFDRVSLLGAMSSSSVSDRALSGRAMPFPLMHSEQVLSSELPASVVLPQKLARAAAVSATVAAVSAAVVSASCDLEDVPPAAALVGVTALVDTTASDAPGVLTDKPAPVGAHFGAGLLMASAPREASSGFPAHASPTSARVRTGGVLQALRGAAAVPPRTPLATGAARMLAQCAAAHDRSGASPKTYDTSRDVSVAAAVRPPGAGARRSLPFSDEDLANGSVLSSETSAEDASATATARAATQRSVHAAPGRGSPTGDAEVTQLGEDSQHSNHSVHSMTCDALAVGPGNGSTAQGSGVATLGASGSAPAADTGAAQHPRAAQCDVPESDEATGPHTHAETDLGVASPDMHPDMHPGYKGVPYSNTECTAAAAESFAEGDAAAEVQGAGDVRAAATAACDNEEAEPGSGDEGMPEALQGRLQELDGDLQRMMSRLRMSWDGAVNGSRGPGGDGLTAPSHRGRPARSTLPGAAERETTSGSAAEDAAMCASSSERLSVASGDV